MTANNAIARYIDGHYSLTIPEDKQAEKDEVLKQAVDKYNGFCHVKIEKVHKPKSIEANALFHGLLTEYYKSGLHSCGSWQELKDLLKYQFGVTLHKITLPDDNKYVVLKSEGDYTMAELSALIDGTIKDMLIKGVDSKKFFEILKGIDYEIK